MSKASSGAGNRVSDPQTDRSDRLARAGFLFFAVALLISLIALIALPFVG